MKPLDISLWESCEQFRIIISSFWFYVIVSIKELYRFIASQLFYYLKYFAQEAKLCKNSSNPKVSYNQYLYYSPIQDP